MITHDQARQLIQEILAKEWEHRTDDSLVINDSATLERNWGWVFFHQSRRWQETGDDCHLLAGNAPYLVERDSGRIIRLGTGKSLEHYLDCYEKYGDPHHASSAQISLLSAAANVDKVAVTQVLRDTLGVGLLAARQKMDAFFAEGKLSLTASSSEAAEILAQKLEALGFVVERGPATHR